MTYSPGCEVETSSRDRHWTAWRQPRSEPAQSLRLRSRSRAYRPMARCAGTWLRSFPACRQISDLVFEQGQGRVCERTADEEGVVTIGDDVEDLARNASQVCLAGIEHLEVELVRKIVVGRGNRDFLVVRRADPRASIRNPISAVGTALMARMLPLPVASGRSGSSQPVARATAASMLQGYASFLAFLVAVDRLHFEELLERPIRGRCPTACSRRRAPPSRARHR